MSFLFFWNFIVVVSCQANLSVSIWEYPQAMVFSKQHDFENGVKSNMTLWVTSSKVRGRRSKWELTIHAEDDNLESGDHTIPVSAIWVNAINSSKVRSTGKKYLSSQYQTIALKKNNSINNNSVLVDIELKAYDGSQFLKPTGEYSTYIYFTLVLD